MQIPFFCPALLKKCINHKYETNYLIDFENITFALQDFASTHTNKLTPYLSK